jgi:hypothetical protein
MSIRALSSDCASGMRDRTMQMKRAVGSTSATRCAQEFSALFLPSVGRPVCCSSAPKNFTIAR